MSLWWLEPGWTAATCAVCGTNIAASGGDPDWGLCYEHMCARHAREPEPQYPEPEWPEPPPDDGAPAPADAPVEEGP